jgi:phosphate/sulfate permease
MLRSLHAFALAKITSGSATWLTVCTRLGFPVSTTQSIVGALVGVGIASNIPVNWGWKKSSVSQIAASWAIAPCIAAGFGAIIFGSIQLLVHSRKDPLAAAIRVLPFYYALTAGILSLFIVISGESPYLIDLSHAYQFFAGGHGIPTLSEMGAGEAIGIVVGVFLAIMLLSAVFFLPYYYRK